jgi:mono/diheme cytochrome c family protein
VVANGRGSMPPFAGSLAPEQITAVVAYTRANLG